MRSWLKYIIPLFIIPGLMAVSHYSQGKEFINTLLNSSSFHKIKSYDSHYSTGQMTLENIVLQDEELDKIAKITIPLEWNNVFFVKPVGMLTIHKAEIVRNFDAQFIQQIKNLISSAPIYSLQLDDMLLTLNTPFGVLEFDTDLVIHNLKSNTPVFIGSLKTKQYALSGEAKFSVQASRDLKVQHANISFSEANLRFDELVITRAFGDLALLVPNNRSQMSLLRQLRAWKSGFFTAGLVKTPTITLTDVKTQRIKDNFLFRFRLPAPDKTEIEGYFKDLSGDTHLEAIIKANSVDEMNRAIKAINTIGTKYQAFQIILSKEAEKTIEKEISENKLQELLISVFGPMHNLQIKITSVTENIYGDVRKHVISLDGL
jgi:hypothetical protein